MSAEEAAALIPAHVNVGMSGFTGAGYPKAVPMALAKHILESNLDGKDHKIRVWTGASTAPVLDGALAMVDGVQLRLPYQSDPVCRKKINAGDMEYVDMHLSHVAQYVTYGFLGKLDTALIEVAGIREDGRLIPSSSVGNNKTWIDLAEKVILEVNAWQNEKMEGMHDIYYGTSLPPNRKPIPLLSPKDRIGTPYFTCPLEKIVAIVETNSPDRNTPFAPLDQDSKKIAEHILDFFSFEVHKGHLPANLLPLQSGVGNIANAVLHGLKEGKFENLSSYTEVIQDGMIELLKAGKMTIASATAFSLSPQGIEDFNANIDDLRTKIILRSEGISNNPELIRRLGCLAMNGMIEADIYGNVNSTHVMGTSIQNGIGGSGDFARNAYISIFMTPSTAKKGAISCIVPMVSHVDHTEHDVQVIVTEQGLADLRGLSPKQRAKEVIEKCAHPDYKPALRDYYRRACELSTGKHTPHLLGEASDWHIRYLRKGSMLG
jgi:succinyl-CoA:acetate CoA-transferase